MKTSYAASVALALAIAAPAHALDWPWTRSKGDHWLSGGGPAGAAEANKPTGEACGINPTLEGCPGRKAYEENTALIAKAAEAGRPGYEAKSNELFTQFQEEYQQELAGWLFEARRWGEYLDVSIKRGDRTYSIALALPDLTTIQVIDGHPPDHSLTLRGNAKLSEWSDISNDQRYVDVPEGHFWEISPRYPAVPKTREFVNLPSFSSTALCEGSSPCAIVSSSSNLWTTTSTTWHPGYPQDDRGVSSGSVQLLDGFAHPALDDSVVFARAGVVIYAPAGKGREVLDQIMTASGKDESNKKAGEESLPAGPLHPR